MAKYLDGNFLFPDTVFTGPRENLGLASGIFLLIVLLLLVATLPLCSPKNCNGFILCVTSNLSQRSRISSLSLSFCIKTLVRTKFPFTSIFSLSNFFPIGIPYQMQNFSVPDYQLFSLIFVSFILLQSAILPIQ